MFRDWAGAWAVYAGVASHCHPEKFSDLAAVFFHSQNKQRFTKFGLVRL